MKKTVSLFLTMLKIGLFTFGGGYAMLSILEHEFVEKKKWIDKDEFLDMIALAESTPGPIAINSATHLGYKAAGPLGSLAATVAVCIPSFVIIYIISLFFDAFLSVKLVSYAFRGIQACVIYLIMSTGIKVFRSLDKKPLSIIIVIAVSAAMITFSLFAVRFSTVFYVLICGTLGVAVYYLGRLLKKGDGES